MNRIFKLVASGSVVIILYWGCYYDKADLVYPSSTSTCDTTNITYNKTITGILSANCYSCHSGSASLGGGIKLDTYTGILPYISNGHLVNDIKQTTGSDPMPKGGAKLDNCSINQIITWINKGASNN
ncbi:MAG TPA: hypothetical protein VHB48_02375 [Chitinophagaceae bacterium]|nr:hypothetical protein [Chitinophagaceae bacterium]